MAISAAFTISQSPVAPSIVTATDTSTGTYGFIVKRRIFFQNSQGQYLTTGGISNTSAYEDWPLANTSQNFQVLQEDTALAITVQWLDVSDQVVNTLTQLYCLSEFNQQFFYYLFQQQALSPVIVQDNVYYNNLATYWMNITGAIQAIEIGADLASSQNCLNRATNMMNNQSKYF